MDFDYLDKYLENSLFSPSNIKTKEGLPFLIPGGDDSFERLAISCSLYIENEKERLASLKDKGSELTRKKNEKHIEARTKQLSRLKKILGSFYKDNARPGPQALNPYEELLFRDWCWETSEIEEYNKYLSPLTSRPTHLFLGAGACGLSYKFAAESSQADIIAADINPFLMLAAQKIINGKSLKVSDTPHFPKSFDNVSNSFNISPKPKLKNHHQVFADFTQLPFKQSSFDHINATWFLDVIEPELLDSLRNIIYFLKDDGSFTYIGPSNFHKSDLNSSYIKEEILQVMEDHFGDVSYEEKSLFYLDSGYNSQKRLEQVLCISAKGPKKEFEKKLKLTSPTAFKLDEKLKFKIAESHTLSQILRHIKGDMSYNDLAKKIQEEFGFDFQQALAYARAVIDKIQSK